MSARRRRRVRAAELAPARPRKSLTALVGVGIALSLLIFYKTHVGDDASKFLEALGVDPGLMLPPSVTMRSPGGVLARGSLAPLASTLAKAAQRCAAPGTVARVEAEIAVAVDGTAVVQASRVDQDATVADGFLDCVARVTVSVPAPLGGPATHRLMVPAWRPAEP